MNNLQNLQGSYPITRVGGNTEYVHRESAHNSLLTTNAYNSTFDDSGDGAATNSKPWLSKTFDFNLPAGKAKALRVVSVQRWMANGSDAITGITFHGFSSNLELDEGLAVKLNNLTTGEVLQAAQDETISVTLPWSSAAILNLQW